MLEAHTNNCRQQFPVRDQRHDTSIGDFTAPIVRTLIGFALVVCARALPVSAATFVYVSVSAESRIASFRMDSETGELTPLPDCVTNGEPGPLATDPQQRFCFASLRSSSELAAYRMNPADGSLTLINRIPVEQNAAYVATDRTGRFLLSASYSGGQIAVHRIKDNGALVEQAVTVIPTAEKAHSILTDRSNRFVFVPHTGPNAIFQFLFDASTGRLTPNPVARVTTPNETGPRHLAFHPTLDVVYFDNEQGSSVTALRLDRATGQLDPLQTLTTLPDDFSGKNTCADIEITPSGRFLLVSNRGHDSLAGFRIDSTTGLMTSTGRFSTEQTPRSFNIDPSEKFVFAAGQGSGKLASYRLDSKRGLLDDLQTYDVGRRPSWVMAVRFADAD